jgi:polyhydroxybutyrate depolymerase
MNNMKFIALLFFAALAGGLQAQSLLSRTIQYDGNSRDYLLYVPASYDGTEALPLIFNLHGGSGSGMTQLATSDMRAMADTAGFFVVYPTALEDPGNGFSRNWTHKPPTTHDDVGFISGMIDSIGADFMLDQQRVYACGYSNGGEFCFDLACRLSDRVAAVTVVATSIFYEDYDACNPTAPMPVLSIHGTADFIRPYNGLSFGGFQFYLPVSDQTELLKDINSTDDSPTVISVPDTSPGDGSTVTHFIWSNGVGCTDVEHMRVNGGGHDWPGTFGNMDIDASQEIWKFSRRYDLSGKINCTAPPACDASNAPENLNSTVTAGGVNLSWDPVPQSVACQVSGAQVSPPGASGNRTVAGFEPSSINIPISFFSPGSIWDWQVRCACSTSPIDATPLSASNSFSIPAPRVGFGQSLLLSPNPADQLVQFEFEAEQSGQLEIRLLDMLGRTAFTQTQNLLPGLQTIQLETGPLAEGSYLLQFVQGSEISLEKLQISH